MNKIFYFLFFCKDNKQAIKLNKQNTNNDF